MLAAECGVAGTPLQRRLVTGRRDGAIRYMGPAGSGQHTKMVNQILIATNMIGCVEGLLYAHK